MKKFYCQHCGKLAIDNKCFPRLNEVKLLLHHKSKLFFCLDCYVEMDKNKKDIRRGESCSMEK